MQLLINDFFDDTILAIHFADSLKKAFSYASRQDKHLTKMYDTPLTYKLLSSRLIPNEPFVKVVFVDAIRHFKLEFAFPFISHSFLEKQLYYLRDLAKRSNYELKFYTVCK